MKRLTQKDDSGYYLTGDGIYSDWGVPEKFRGEDVDRLAAIEDILCDGENDYDLERLAAVYNQRMSMRDEVSERFSLTAKIPLDRLGELVEAADLLGKTVYEPNKRGFISTYEIISVHISIFSVLVGWNLLDGIYSNLNGFEISALGKTVFLTRAEAEAALKAREQE